MSRYRSFQPTASQLSEVTETHPPPLPPRSLSLSRCQARGEVHRPLQGGAAEEHRRHPGGLARVGDTSARASRNGCPPQVEIAMRGNAKVPPSYKAPCLNKREAQIKEPRSIEALKLPIPRPLYSAIEHCRLSPGPTNRTQTFEPQISRTLALQAPPSWEFWRWLQAGTEHDDDTLNPNFRTIQCWQ